MTLKSGPKMLQHFCYQTLNSLVHLTLRAKVLLTQCQETQRDRQPERGQQQAALGLCCASSSPPVSRNEISLKFPPSGFTEAEVMFATSGSSGERGKHKVRLCCLSNPVPGVSHNGFPSTSTKRDQS